MLSMENGGQSHDQAARSGTVIYGSCGLRSLDISQGDVLDWLILNGGSR
jgi:hypothetical protein